MRPSSLTSRERVRAALDSKPVDRLPNGLGGTETTGLHVLAYEKLKKTLGVNDPACRMSTFMTTGLMEPPVLDAAGGDIILLATKLCPARFWGAGATDDWKDESFWGAKVQTPKAWGFTHAPDGTIYWEDTRMKCPPGGIYFDHYPLVSKLLDDEESANTDSSYFALSADALEDSCPSPDDYHPRGDYPDEFLRALEEMAAWLYRNTEYSISCGEMITDLQLTPGGTENWWMRLVREPQAAHDFLAKAVEAALNQITLLDQAIGKYADMMQIANDIGDARGVTIGPRLWRKVYKPHYMELFQGWHARTRMKVNLHCCGSVSDILGDLIECGVDIYNPVQISGTNMSPESLKARFGSRLIFYGGAFDAIQTPPHTAAEVVYETVRANIAALAADGGYIFAGVHNIPGDTPVEHLKAILQAYRDESERLYG